VKNRMPEIGTSGSVRGEDGDILTYSAVGVSARGVPDVAALIRASVTGLD